MGMYGWTKRKLKNGKDRVKRRTKAVGRWVRKNREDIAEEVTETVLDVDSPMPSSSSYWGDKGDLSMFRRSDPVDITPTRPSGGIDLTKPSGGGSSGTSGKSGGSDWTPSHGGGVFDGSGCGDGCTDGCDLGCDFMLLAMFFYVPYYHIKGHPWHERHAHRRPRPDKN